MTATLRVLGGELDLDPGYVDASRAELRRQLREYERGDRHAFDLEVRHPDGFVGEVTRALRRIPYGEVRTYGELAGELDTAAVAVGSACGRNPLPVVVPCHRVVASDGVGGYSAPGGVELKRRLLEHEAVGLAEL